MMKKPKINIQEFPKIFRTIPENKLFKKALKSKTFKYLSLGFISVLCILLALSIIIIGTVVYRNVSILIQTSNQRKEIRDKIAFWQSVVEKYPAYKDAYFQIAALEYRLGDFENARQANNKALLLDPSFKNAEELESLLNGN